MARYGLCIDLGRCIGCYGCVVGCKNWHGVAAGETGRISLKDFFTGMYPQVSRWVFPVMCMHCEHPPCVSVCRYNACHQREDGIVIIDPKRCVGCELCTFACPFGLRTFRQNQGVADGCDFCLERISSGGLPYCVESCPTGALEKPFCLDASRCLSYLTVEHKGIPHKANGRKMGDCFFGCDRCQEVCPFNGKERERNICLPSAQEFLHMEEEVFLERFGRTSFARAGFKKIKANIRLLIY